MVRKRQSFIFDGQADDRQEEAWNNEENSVGSEEASWSDKNEEESLKNDNENEGAGSFWIDSLDFGLVKIKMPKSLAFCRSFRLFFIAALILLTGYVGWVQIVPQNSLGQMARRQQTRKLYVPAKRGMIADRNGIALNYTIPSYSMAIRAELVRDPRDTRQKTFEKISAVIARLGLFLGPEFYDSRPTNEVILKHLVKNTPMPLELWDDIDFDSVARWNAHRDEFPGVELVMAWKRFYAEPWLAPLWRGFTHYQRRDFLWQQGFWNANYPELNGAVGIELLCNDRLTGKGGSELLQTDVMVYRKAMLESEAAVAGLNVTLTMDSELQAVAQQALDESEYCGAAVLMNMISGEVLVMANSPVAPLGDKQAVYNLNRVLAGYYAPGSVIKPLLAVYALQNGLIDETTSVTCDGGFAVTERQRLGCNGGRGHGTLTVRTAIAKSCNVFFCTIARRMAAHDWNDFASIFGLGTLPGSVFSQQEQPGVGFTPEWTQRYRTKEPGWYPADNANAAIGQGGWIITPIQLACAYAMLFTGKRPVPKFYLEEPLRIAGKFEWNPECRRLVAEGMELGAKTGTGRNAAVPEMRIMTKTGTAEVGGNKRPHGWCVAVFPAENPEYVAICVIENGGMGGKVAAPIVKKILQAIQQQKRAND